MDYPLSMARPNHSLEHDSGIPRVTINIPQTPQHSPPVLLAVPSQPNQFIPKALLRVSHLCPGFCGDPLIPLPKKLLELHENASQSKANRGN